MTKIDITNPGPIEGLFTIDLSSGPGAYELRGARGTGKTTCIDSIDWLAGRRVAVTLHDGAVSGRVEGFGVVAPIGGRKRRKGDFELDTIDAEKFTLTDLIDPPGKTPEVRDAHAIKALAVLSETKADSVMYYELAGGQVAFDALGIQETTDPVLLATRIKTAYDQCARARQATAEAEAAHAAPLEHVPDDLDMSQSFDLLKLCNDRDEARDKHQSMEIERDNGITKEDEIVEAGRRMVKLRGGYSGPIVEDAEAAIEAAIEAVTDAEVRARELQRELDNALAAVNASMNERGAAKSVYEAAKSHHAAIEELASTASQTVTYPEAADIAEAGVSVDEATEAYNRGVQIRDVTQNQERAKSFRVAEEIAARESAAARNKAGQVFDILAQSLNTKHLEIHTVDGCPRLFVQHPIRHKTLFDRVNGLSDGERVDYALRELVPHIKSPGMLLIPQRIWQDLQPSDRMGLHEVAVEKEIFVFGAQVDDGELRVCYLGDE